MEEKMGTALVRGKILQSKMPVKKKFSTLRLILGDQLNPQHSWYAEKDDSVLYLMMEVSSESEYVTHHIQKVAGIFAAMRKFAEWLRSEGHHVRYFKITDPDNYQNFQDNLRSVAETLQIKKISCAEPDEYRLDHILAESAKHIGLPLEMVSSEHFYTERSELKELFSGKKQYLMETFYRAMRKKHGVLMETPDNPVSGRWNFDQENRKKLPSGHTPPAPFAFNHDLSEVVSNIESAGIRTIGSIHAKHFSWPLTRKEALDSLSYFLENLLPHFGTFQDALSDNHSFIYHSRLSFALNLKMISPREVCQQTEAYWRQHQNEITLAQAEGFIRQIIGWREYMRGIYWAEMPDFATRNFFNHKAPLPDFYWTANTKMRCVQSAVQQSLDHAYAHHIQRLMVTGNFALLAGVSPDELDQWYLGIYIDAFEWVEITNTRGMSQFADGGIVGTKPYVSSGTYLNKMGDHCKQCIYDPKKNTGQGACPFNSLYWNFLHQNRELLAPNPRMSLMYRVWDKFDDQKKTALLNQAEQYLNNVNSL
jgi:deoxyribodipyrimidine photolyase-related protein